MDNPLCFALWNANELTQHAEEPCNFISDHNKDVMLISETHFTDKNYFKLPFHSVYHTNHLAGTAHGGSAIILKNSIQHNLHNGYSSDYLHKLQRCMPCTYWLKRSAAELSSTCQCIHYTQFAECTSTDCK
jgi:exonuclease III